MIEVACSNTDGKQLFHRSIFDEVSTLEPVDLQSRHVRRKARVLLTRRSDLYSAVEVETTRLDTFITAAKPLSIDILKIDVEGHEMSVLYGAARALQNNVFQVVQLESHPNGDDAETDSDVSIFLKSHGYRREARVRHSIGRFYDEIWVSEALTALRKE